MELTLSEKNDILIRRMSIQIEDCMNRIGSAETLSKAADIYEELASFVRKTSNDIDKINMVQNNDS